jgi:hypothetical protein
MGKALVVAFLATLLAALLTAVILAAELVVSGIEGLGLALGGHPPPLTFYLPSDPLFRWWLYAVGVYLLLVVPLVTLVILGAGLRRAPRAAHPIPPTWDMRGKKVVVVLTALDDEASIAGAVDEHRALPEVGTIIVAENQSQDRTAAVAREHGARVVTVPQRGYGYTCIGGLREALRATTEDVIVLSEGDGTFFADDLRKLVPYLADCDLALGTRTNRELNRPGSQMDWFMAWGNLFLAFLVRLRHWDAGFWGSIQITDVGCTFRAIRRSALERILPDLTVGGMYFSPHMILVALRQNLAIVEAPIKFRRRVGPSKGAGHSRRRALSIGLEMLKEITLH